MRAKAGWFAALLYLFCVLVPGAALALGDAASCLTTENQTTGNQATTVRQVHEQTLPMHAASAAHLHHGAQAGHHANAGTHEHAGHEHGGKTSPGPCCAMLCLSAITANLPAFAKPPQPISVRISENFQRLPGKAPPLLYRPPIA